MSTSFYINQNKKDLIHFPAFQGAHHFYFFLLRRHKKKCFFYFFQEIIYWLGKWNAEQVFYFLIFLRAPVVIFSCTFVIHLLLDLTSYFFLWKRRRNSIGLSICVRSFSLSMATKDKMDSYPDLLFSKSSCKKLKRSVFFNTVYTSLILFLMNNKGLSFND